MFQRKAKIRTHGNCFFPNQRLTDIFKHETYGTGLKTQRKGFGNWEAKKGAWWKKAIAVGGKRNHYWVHKCWELSQRVDWWI